MLRGRSSLVRAWVHGQYTNKAQFESDLARKLPPEQIHRQLHQFFAPLTVADSRVSTDIWFISMPRWMAASARRR